MYAKKLRSKCAAYDDDNDENKGTAATELKRKSDRGMQGASEPSGARTRCKAAAREERPSALPVPVAHRLIISPPPRRLSC